MWHWKLPEPFSQITSWILLSCSHHSRRTCNQHSLAVNNSEDVFTDHNGPPPPERGMDSQHPCIWCRAFLVAQTVKNLPAIQEIWIWSLSQEDPLKKGIHSSILAWRIPWTEGSGGLQSMELQRVGHDKQLTHTHTNTHIHTCILCYLPVPGMISFLSFRLCRMCNLSSPTRDRTHAPTLAVWSLNHWTTREVPLEWFLIWHLHNNSKDHNNNSSYFECLLCVRHITRYLTLFPLNLKISWVSISLVHRWR